MIGQKVGNCDGWDMVKEVGGRVIMLEELGWMDGDSVGGDVVERSLREGDRTERGGS